METEPLRILIVDDSRIFRGLLQSVLEQLPGVQVVGSVFSGEKALEFLQNTPVDLVTLDVEMPGIGGLETLRQIEKRNRDQFHSNSKRSTTRVLLLSSLTKQGAVVTVEGLQLGAFDFLCKPMEGTEQSNRETLKAAMAEKIEALRTIGSRRATSITNSRVVLNDGPKAIETKHRGKYRAIAIGTSTGGPEALGRILPELASRCDAPIFIVQHILEGLSQYLAQSLAKKCGRSVIEVQDSMYVEPRGIYLAQSGKHMLIRNANGRHCVATSTAPPEKGFRPSIDIFFRSAAAAYGSTLVAAILTGMRDDGAEGVRAVKRADGFVAVQDEASCVVASMPQAALATGAVDRIVQLDEMADFLARLVGGDERS